MSRDVFTVTAEDLIRAAGAMEKTPGHGRLRYWATPSQYNSPVWRTAFERLYPDVEVLLQEQIPTKEEG